MSLDLTVLDDAVPAPAGGAPLELPIDTIDEDPEQPRFEFDDEPLAELAGTIRQRGVRQPVSVRPHPEQPGRWMLNFGARRLRASRMAGRQTVPAFVDLAADSYDQVIENEQRQNLQPLELALFVQRRLRAGETQADVARCLGKSRAYVTYVVALIDAPDPVMALYRSGRCRGLTELYDLRRLHELRPQAVTEWLNTADKVTRTEIDRLKHELRSPTVPVPEALAQDARSAGGEPVRNAGDMEPHPQAESATAESAASIPVPAAGTRACPPDASHGTPRPPSRWQLIAELDGTDVVVEMRRLPQSEEQVFVSGLGAKDVVAVDIDRLRALRLVRTAA
ncbi:ParB/RepB/Spo0J family partition protein [Rubrivivax gelatinosus]|uniref:ParB family chromosome partitioning protein n=1 Tax=Rubrivivax gelatinosus TaxID=28068 RepID=A0A4R2M9N7_RUBGE|nr:ParB/RepB/Spo0J family partition protein [Rubrivivax gelatinosus]MBK1687770.1 hypothetical protein [Rubrivivax gelatinosus]TCP03392.1 ParB family chromosome partitioning protein [Rubrivivax gelatinosus]